MTQFQFIPSLCLYQNTEKIHFIHIHSHKHSVEHYQTHTNTHSHIHTDTIRHFIQSSYYQNNIFTQKLLRVYILTAHLLKLCLCSLSGHTHTAILKLLFILMKSAWYAGMCTFIACTLHTLKILYQIAAAAVECRWVG